MILELLRQTFRAIDWHHAANRLRMKQEMAIRDYGKVNPRHQAGLKKHIKNRLGLATKPRIRVRLILYRDVRTSAYVYGVIHQTRKRYYPVRGRT